MAASAPDPDDRVDEVERPPMRGLWDVMRQAAASPGHTPDSPDTATSADAEPERTPTGKGLWSLMARASDEQVPHETPASAEVSQESAEPQFDVVASETIAEDAMFPGTTSPTSLRESPAEPQRRRSVPPDIWGLVSGVAALPLSAAAFWPGLAGSLPSAALGFVALALACVVWTHACSSRGSRIRAAAGAIAGLLAIAAGPAVFAPWGNSVRDRQSIRSTQLHLEAIGVALDQHHDNEGFYPVGGTRMTDADGKRRGGHGWMTRLLPYIGHVDVYEQIQLDLPFDDPANRPALSTPIETFFAAGGSRRPVWGGFAAAHFAGVGGTVTTTRGEELPAGIFELGRPVRQRDVVDGLATTWIVGEVPGGYPPWGDPENWRSVVKGLNRDPRGFGDAAGTGAMLLFADGSVRFYGNQTDVDLLRRFSTRSGYDLAP